MNKAQLRAIVKQDNARRAAREAQEDALLAQAYSPCPEGVDPYLFDRGITGVPSAGNRDYKASRNCWDRGMRGRTFGIAQDGAAANTMLVNGVVMPVPTRKRESRAAVRVTRTTTPEALQFSLPSIRAGETY